MNRSAVCDMIETYTWRMKCLLKERHALVAKASWSEDDEVNADYIDEMCKELSLNIQELQNMF